MAEKHVEPHAGNGEHDDVYCRAQRQADEVERERQENKRKRGKEKRRVFIAHRRLLERLDALAEKAARAHQQHQCHQQIHGGFAPGWVEVDGDAAHDADKDRGGDDAPERAQAADHDHDEGGGEDFGPHGRVHACDRGEQHAGKSGQSDAERRDRRHVGRQRDPERADHVWVLHARAHDAAERGAIDDEPGRGHRGYRNAQDDEAVSRINEVANEDLAAQLARDRKRQRGRAEYDAQTLLDDHGEPEGQQQAQDGVGTIEAAEQQSFDRNADETDRERRGDERAGETDAIRQDDREVSADRIETAVGEVDDAAEREDQRQAEGDQQVIGADQEPVENLFEYEDELHAALLGREGG